MTDKPIDTKASREIRAAGTPGEWEAVMEEQPVCYYRSLVCIAASDGEYVSVVADGRQVTRDEWKPNARLIAHATNQLVPMCVEIDRLRAELEAKDGALDKLRVAARSALRFGLASQAGDRLRAALGKESDDGV